MKKFLAVLVSLLVFATACSSGSTPSPLSDVTGLAGDLAKDLLEDDGLVVTLKDGAGDRAVIVASNWIVTSQDPAAGAPMSEGGAVTLTVEKDLYADDSGTLNIPTEESTYVAPAPAPEPTTEELPPAPEPTTEEPPPAPEPTTEEPAPAAAPTFKKLDFSGTSDDVLTIPAHTGMVLAVDANFTGEGNFTVKGDGQLLVNTIGTYSGVTVLDLRDGEATAQLVVGGAGTWTVSVRDITTSMRVKTGAQAKGVGDMVYINEAAGGVGAVKCQCEGNFVVQVVSSDGIDLAVNEIGVYAGKVPFSGPGFVIVKADGPWTVDVT